MGYLERNEPLPLDQPDRKATTFVTSHFYLDDFVQSSEDPNPQPLQHTPLRAIPEEGFRTPAEATDEDLARMRQGGGNRFGEDDLAGDPEADALTNNGQGPPSITGRLRSAADGAQAAADLVGAGAAGLAAVQAFRSQLPQDAAEYVRLNVLPRPGPQPQPPPQIIGRPDDVERLLDEVGQRAQEVERGAAQAIEETAAVAAEERGRRRSRGRGRGLRVLGGPGRRSSSPRTHGGRGCSRHGLGAGRTRSSGLSKGSEDANNMNDATQPQHFTLRSGSSTSGSPASSQAPAAQDARAACLRRATTSWPEISRRPRLSFAVRAKMSVALQEKKHGGSHSRSDAEPGLQAENQQHQLRDRTARCAVFSQLAELLLPRHLEGLPHSSDQRHLVHRPRVYQDRLQSQKHGRRQPAGACHSEPSLFHSEDPASTTRTRPWRASTR